MAANVAKLLKDLGQGDVDLRAHPSALQPIKNRLVTPAGVQIARWDLFDSCEPLTEDDFQDLYSDLIIVSDYGKGAISPYAISRLKSIAEAGTHLFIDTKMDPFVWMGDNITLFPNQYEWNQYAQHYEWMASVVYKQGSQGMSYMKFGEEQSQYDATCNAPLNVCGAGDAVLAAFVNATTLALSADECLQEANVIAGYYVSHPYWNRSVTP
jgi:bifunctional ADP-heptose synthase (sugar kinase/adenylyltransferase)